MWDGAVKAYFNGKPAEVLSASDWQRFVLDGFVRKPIENPIGDEQEFTESDIP